MRKNTQRGDSAGLLEPGQRGNSLRPQRYAETAEIPGPAFEENPLQETEDPQADEVFLRAKQRVPVRRRGGSRFKSRFLSRFRWNSGWVRAAAVLIAIGFLALAGAAAWEGKSLLLHNRHFFLESVEDISVTGNRVVRTAQARAPFAADAGRSIFRVPLAERQAQLKKIPWVRNASVMRLWPNRLRVNLVERTPVAFVRDGNTIRLVDGQGVVLDLPAATDQRYSFPVLTGISGADPRSMRAARVAIYVRFIHALDAGGDHFSNAVSEVDLTDAEDVRAIFTGGVRQPLVHFGDRDFLARYRAYQAHLTEWLRQYPELQSVDMRYGRQIVLDTGATPPMPATPAPAEAATPSAAREKALPSPEMARPKAHGNRTHGNGKGVRKASVKKTLAGKHAAAARSRSARKRPRAIRKRTRLPVPQRGHPVSDPIMHVVSGT